MVEEEYPFNSVVVIEFKRPERNAYGEEKSPIRQVLGYVKSIREGKAKDKAGKTIKIDKSLPFYCYVIATLTPNLEEEAEINNLTITPDSAGYFGYNQNYGAYIEVISFDKLLADAKKRNKVFFDKLSL